MPGSSSQRSCHAVDAAAAYGRLNRDVGARLAGYVQAMHLNRLWIVGVAALVIAVLGGCGGDESGSGPDGAAAPTGAVEDPAGERVDIGGEEALVWGEGEYGVVLAHGAAFDAASWEAQATEIAERGMVALAVEDIAPESILGAAEYLMNERGVEDVALVGGSAGADGILEAASQEPGAPDQLILLSANQAVQGLGPEPKLFIASEGEPLVDVSRELARSAPGDENDAHILPGNAHAQNIFDSDQGEVATRAIFERLERFSG